MFRRLETVGGLDTNTLMTSALSYEPSFLDFASDVVTDEFLRSYGIGTLVRRNEIAKQSTRLETVPGFENMEGFQPKMLVNTGAPLTEDDYKKSPYFREEIPYDPAMTVDRAAALASWHDHHKVREQLIRQADRPVSQFFLGILGQLPDPINYIPVVGPGLRAAAIGRAGVIGGRALAGSADAALNTAIFGAATASERIKLGDNVTFAEFMTEVAGAALIGAAFGTGSGILHNRRIRREAAAARHVTDAQAALGDAVETLALEDGVRLSDAVAARVQVVASRNQDLVLSPEMADVVDQIVVDNGLEKLSVAQSSDSFTVRQEAFILPDGEVYVAPEAKPNVQAPENLPPEGTKFKLKTAKDVPIVRVRQDGAQIEIGADQGLVTPSQQARIEAIANAAREQGVEPKVPDQVPEVIPEKSIPERAGALETSTKFRADPGRPVFEVPAEKLARAEAAVGKVSRSAKDLADEFDIDAETGQFPEMDEIKALEEQGRITEGEKAMLEAADKEKAEMDIYNELLRVAAMCEMN